MPTGEDFGKLTATISGITTSVSSRSYSDIAQHPQGIAAVDRFEYLITQGL
jgi:hypothetical protein